MFYKDKKVLVTGGAGFVGTNFVEALLERGAYVRVPVHRRPPRLEHERLEAMPADLTRLEDCLKVCEGMQYVVHAAGAVSAAAVTSSSPMAVISANSIVSIQMLQAAWTAGIDRFLLLSSTTVYPAAERAIKEEEAWSGPTHPSYFAYGWMRRYLERMAEFVAERSKMKIALVRPTAIYGPWDNFDPLSSHVVPALVRKAAEKLEPFEVWGTGREVRDFVYVADAVRGGLACLEKYAVCDPVNLGYGRAFTVGDVVRILLKASGHEAAKVHFDASKPTTIPFRMVDITKAREKLGFEPEVTLEDGLTRTLKWYRGSLAKAAR